MQTFKRIKLGQALTFQRGFDITKAEQTQGSIPIVSSSGISSYHNVAKVDPPGVIIGRKGTLGTVHAVNTPFWPHDTTLWVKDFKGNDPRFLYYFLKTLHLENFDTGSSNPTLNRNHLHKIEVVFPVDVDVQLKIAGILSAYDDLIENNRRRIAILERMAEELYREWFVRMRFPGYQNTKFVKGVPEDWKEATLSHLASATMGQSPSSEFYNSTGDGLPFNQGVGTYGFRFPRRETWCSVDGRRARQGDILFSVRAPVGRLNIADCEMIIGRGLAAIRHKLGFNTYLFYLLRVTFSREDIIGNGSIFNSVGRAELEGYKLYKPPSELQERFDKTTRPLDRKIELLVEHTENLSKARSSLLSRLVSGKTATDELEIRTKMSTDFATAIGISQELTHA